MTTLKGSFGNCMITEKREENLFKIANLHKYRGLRTEEYVNGEE